MPQWKKRYSSTDGLFQKTDGRVWLLQLIWENFQSVEFDSGKKKSGDEWISALTSIPKSQEKPSKVSANGAPYM